MSVYMNDLGEYPRYMGDVQLVLPEWQPGDALPTGWVEVQEVLGPSVDDEHTYYELAPEEVDGVWTQQWAIRQLTADEIGRRDAKANAIQRFITLGFTQYEIEAILRGLR